MSLTETTGPLLGNTNPIVHLSANGVSLVVDTTGPRLPRVVHWGEALGGVGDDQLRTLVETARPPVVSNSLNRPTPLGLIAEASIGWTGTPGIVGHHDGTDFSALFSVEETTVSGTGRGGSIRAVAVDADLALGLTLEITLTPSGLVTLRATLQNQGDAPYVLDSLTPNLPVPLLAQEILDFNGRHLRERAPQRHPFVLGTYAREGRHGRTGADATLLLAVGTPGFSFEGGEVWGIHTGWSGNHTTYAERDSAGAAILGGGELLLAGEVRLQAGESYSTPTIYGSYGHGLNALSSRFHDYLRARPNHPSSSRLVALNTWEAVYFDHDLDTLKALADRAASVGVERYILDDGWFRHRRDDTAGLGDWYVDETVWPDGLHPLVDHVRSRGMQFGLWFEPEMINVDSDVARAHPDWIMSTGFRLPPEARNQQVLDLANPEAYAFIFERMDSLVSEYALDYIKWDHNRDLVDAGHPGTGRAGVHDQTLAVYRLVDELKAAHPGLEIESCSSGGARADLGMLERTERIWGSDCIDALERQQNQRWTGLILPPEMIGSHIGAPTAHTTSRTHSLDFRAGTALFGHFGIEWDVTSASDTELAELTQWVALHKELRPLLHGGTVIRADHNDPAHWLHGVVATDRSEAVFAFVALETGAWAPPGRIRFPGLDDRSTYRVETLSPVARPSNHGLPALPDWSFAPIELSGRLLRTVGVQAPALPPEQLQLFRIQKVTG